ncbi:hypothetical protein GQ457_03G025980 [Hibiscus cannabinus]
MSHVPICKCEKEAVLKTAWSDDIPGRRFYGCNNYESLGILSVGGIYAVEIGETCDAILKPKSSRESQLYKQLEVCLNH